MKPPWHPVGMPTQLLTERFAFSGGTVDTTDPEQPFVRGVPLCGTTSANRRRYKLESFAGDRVKRYGNRPSFLNHGKRNESREYESKIAVVVNERHRADGLPVGDLAVNPKHPMAAAFLWDAKHHPESIGMSHVAECKFERAADGWDEVTEIVRVESVDIVIGPATTSGLFTAEGRTVPHTIKTLTEWVVKHPKATADQAVRAKQFLEFDMGMAETPVEAAPADDADPEDGLTAAFKAYLHAHVDALADESQTIDEFVTKVKAAFKAHKGKEPKEGGDGEPKKDAAEEAKSAKALADLPFTILSECQAKNFTPGTATLKAMTQMTAEERAAFITEQAAKGTGHTAERIQSAQRRPGAGTAGSPNANAGTGGTQKVEEQRLIPAWN